MIIGKQSFILENKPKIMGYASVVGKKEGEGRFGKEFSKIFEDDGGGSEGWEKAESFLLTNAVTLALASANLSPSDVNYIVAGDLLNQCIGTTFGLRDLNIPFLGAYGACSTMSESMLISALIQNGVNKGYALAATCSHFCSAERQFRYPLEYGGQRTPAAQWTVTGSGAVVIGDIGKIDITHVTIGKIVDKGIADPSNMGAAMAPAFVDTVITHFQDTGLKPSDYDLIVSGDLGKVGKELSITLLSQNGYSVQDRMFDCGEQIFFEKQDAHSGGSGCGCAASVLCGHILPRLEKKQLKRVLFCATGALMSPTSSLQGETIPGISHAVALSAV